MRAAPPVAAPPGDGRPERVLIALLYATTGACLAAWMAGLAEASPSATLLALGAGAALCGLPGMAWARRLLPADVTQLAWDGRAWTVRLAAAPAHAVAVDALAVSLDLGPWLLLRLQLRMPMAGGPVRWLVLRERQAGPAWHLLRVALRAQAGAAG